MVSRWRGIVTLSLLVALLGCSSSTKPHRFISEQERPFYYRQDGARVYLGLDSSRVTVSTSLPMPDSALSVLGAMDIGVDSVRTLWKPNHYVIWFSQGTSWRDASEAALALRLAKGFDFASNAYIDPLGGAVFVLVDEFPVMFEENTPWREIEKLNHKVGTEVIRKSGPDSLWLQLSYPVNSVATPLEVVAYYYERQIVRYARPWFSVHGPP